MATNTSRRVARGGKIKAPKRIGLEVTVEDMWNRLASAIGHIQNHDIGSLSYEEHYRYAYNLVLYHHGDLLYSGVRKLVEQHLITTCEENVVTAFPPGSAALAPAGIILPKQIIAGRSKTGNKGKAPANGASQNHSPMIDSDANGFSDSLTRDVDEADVGDGAGIAKQGGDRADAVSRVQAGERLLRAIRDTWEDHCACMSKLKDVLKYVDRVYVEQTGVAHIWDLGLELFRDTVLRSTRYAIHQHLYSTILTQIQLEREGFVINRSTLKSNIDMLLSLTHPQPNVERSQRPTIYKHDFEPAFLATSAEYYKTEAGRLLDGQDASQYLLQVERRFLDEEARVAVYLSSATDRPLSRILEKWLLSENLETVLETPGSGIVAMLEEGRRDDLARMYRLYWRVQEGPNVFKRGLKGYVSTKGKEINEMALTVGKSGAAGRDEEAEAGPSTAAAASTPQAQMALRWVEDVLALKVKMDQVQSTSLQDDKGCETSINEAFETFVNLNPRSPEYISLFIDENLKKGLKGKSEEEVEEVLQRTITVFRFLHEKDIFERYYKNHLAKRLLQGRSVSDDAERSMMAKFKVESGHGYVQKLQGMLNDMKVSDDTMRSFGDSLSSANRSMPFDLGVSVLTSTYWPISAQAPPCVMPPNMIEARQAFEAYYQARHSGRRLTWHPNYGNADVKVQFRARKHDLNVSTYALVVLLLFENVREGETLSYAKIQESTGILDADLGRTLQSLACAKYKILLKTPKGRDVNKDDVFAFNDGFQCNLARIKISQIAARVESNSERKETAEKVDEERKNQIEACLVRVMKDRKTMTHNELINEVIRQLATRFQPSPGLVKKRIESLIDREYLERSESSMNVYQYLA